ncbi:MAG TPA: ABC transporter permease [Gemmatimonadaceae bacterium]|nr:ABC transporter permease [Gemmatimonadaceae bacterium]
MGWYRRFTNLLRSNRVSADIDREMAFHMNELADDLVARGMPPDDARREARRRFGNPSVQKERTRDADILTWLESLGADVRYALRALRASPVFALVTILSLGLGIGANTAIFSLINAVVLRTLPVARPEELVQVVMDKDEADAVFTNPIWEQIRDQQRVFSGVFAYGVTGFTLSAGGEVRRALGSWVSGDYFSTLGVQPALGRLLTRSDDVPGCPPVAVLGHGFWETEFGGSRDVVGKTMPIGGKPHVIVGVTDPSFFGVEVGRSIQVFAPLCLRSNLQERSNWFLNVIGRPKPGVTAAQVSSRLATLAPTVYGATIPQDWGVAEKANYLKNTLDARPADRGQSDIRRRYQQALTVLMAVVGLVLLIACANVANLLLARAAVRTREMAIRLAIGAARQRLVRQLLTESVLLAGLGAVVGILVAHWGSALLVSTLSRGPFPISLDLGVDGRVLAFTLLVAMITGILFGLAPAWRAVHVDPQAALKSNGRGVVEGHSRLTIGKVLVVAQIAMSLVLVVGAGLLLGSFRKLTTLNPGFKRDGVLLVDVNLARAGYAPGEYAGVRRDLLERFRALPGVVAAGSAAIVPISGSGWNDVIRVDGFVPRSQDDAQSYFNEVTDGHFATLGTPLLAGRDFDARDGPTSPRVAIVNEAMVRKFFQGASPIGKSYRTVMHDTLSPPVEIVGVVKDSKYRQMREEPISTIYLAQSQAERFGSGATYELRAAGEATSLVPAVKRMLAAMNPAIAIELQTMASQVEASLAREQLLARLSAFFGGLALLLATVGLYGTLSYNVARRRNEIGIRIALGAARERVVRLVLGEVTRIVLAGVVVGALAALASTRWVASLLYGLEPSDPATLIGSAVVLGVVGLAAGVLPAWRAARVDPISALREE